MEFKSVIAVIPAAGVGSRMKADHPKQYLSIAGDSTPNGASGVHCFAFCRQSD